ncbi:MAG: DinB family protein [Spirochaetales bacterium]|nr:DinB family protein [Spirochaetales bacterium]
MKMKKEIEKLENHISALYETYHDIDEITASIKLSEDSWSIKEIFGHLIDSAANNYQRFIRLQETSNLTFPGYDYNWIEIVKYNAYPFAQIIELWKQYNLLLCHIIDNADSESLNNTWQIEGKSLNLEFLIVDYIEHLEIHVEQLEKRYLEVMKSVENE